MDDKVVEARRRFGAAYHTALEDPKLQWPPWLDELRSNRTIHRALKDAGLPQDLGRELAILALTLHTTIVKAPPPTRKEVRLAVTRIAERVRRLHADVGRLPSETDNWLLNEFRSIERDNRDIHYWFEDDPINEISALLDVIKARIERIKLPPPAQRGPKISPVTTAVEALIDYALERRPDTSSRALTGLTRAVLEPAVNNAVGPDGSRVDWHDQVSRALRAQAYAAQPVG